MSKEVFLTPEEEQEIVAAITMAEKETSGEIRVHIENTSSLAAYDRALIVFEELKMPETELKNGVLIYLAVSDKAFAICGDKGINDLVPTDFWDTTKEAMLFHFKNGNFKEGLVDGIQKAGSQLKSYFPWQKEDANELTKEI